MNTIAIFGVGLIGGSFALALRKAGFDGKILGVSSARTVTRALERGVIDAAESPQAAAEQADVVYLAQPVLTILDTLPQLNAWIRPGVLVTDAGSTKEAIVTRAEQSLTRAQFLGGHPLAGKESRGLDSADADLFNGRTYVLTPSTADDLTTAPALAFRGWVERIGAVPVILSAADHDRTVAVTSHLPQLAAIALGMLLSTSNWVENGLFGPALVEGTRLALSSYEIWADIFGTNTAAIDTALSGYIEELQTLRRDLTSPAMAEHFRAAAGQAARLRGRVVL